jgi:hypothetical protein
MNDLRTKTARSKLKPRSSAYSQVIANGLALAYRKRSAKKPGRWMLRTRSDGSDRYDFEVLGDADDLADADGRDILSFSQAMGLALKRTSTDPTRISVADALDAWAKGKCRTASSDKQRLDYRSSA